MLDLERNSFYLMKGSYSPMVTFHIMFYVAMTTADESVNNWRMFVVLKRSDRCDTMCP